jgi:hypothetical protein
LHEANVEVTSGENGDGVRFCVTFK